MVYAPWNKGKRCPYVAEMNRNRVVSAATRKKIGMASKGRVPKNIRPEGAEIPFYKYILVKIDNHWVLKHRIIYARFHKIVLKSTDIIHHKDFNSKNNSIKNLQLMSRGEHRLIHMR